MYAPTLTSGQGEANCSQDLLQHWPIFPISQPGVTIAVRSSPDRRKTPPCTQPDNHWGKMRARGCNGRTSSPQSNSSPCLSFSLSHMCRNWVMPCSRTWFAYFFPSSQSRGVPSESNPIAGWRQRGLIGVVLKNI